MAIGLGYVRRREAECAAIGGYTASLASLLMSDPGSGQPARLPVVAINYCTVKRSLWIDVTRVASGGDSCSDPSTSLICPSTTTPAPPTGPPPPATSGRRQIRSDSWEARASSGHSWQ